jgi:hypothetical protein
MLKPAKRGGFQSKTIEEEIAHLRDLDLATLRVCWQNELGRLAPEHLTRYLLFRILAYKIQADRLGDLDADTLKVLKRASGNEGGAISYLREACRVGQAALCATAGDRPRPRMGSEVP